MNVYLAGPIAGLDYGAAVDWRHFATEYLRTFGVRGVSPMRSKAYLKDVRSFSGTCEPEADLGPFSGARAVMTRDRWDATRCDVMLVNFVGATEVSKGTIMEIAWADLSRIPIVCAMEPGNLHEHAMILEAIGFRTATLNDALQVVAGLQ